MSSVISYHITHASTQTSPPPAPLHAHLQLDLEKKATNAERLGRQRLAAQLTAAQARFEASRARTPSYATLT